MSLHKKIRSLKITKLESPMPMDAIHIYMIKLVDYPYFYIGQTDSVYIRMRAHVHTIASILEGKDCRQALTFHNKVANHLSNRYKSQFRLKAVDFVMNSIEVSIIDVAADRLSAFNIETDYIRKHTGNPFFLNSKKINR